VGAAATRAGVPRVLLTHVPPWHDKALALRDARTTYSGDVALAEPLQTYDV
jgi:ribonuclease BN (tRNA processing enzyme)